MVEPRWQKEGTEPDYRFSLANERTFLAWIRTAMALIAAAVVVVHFLPPAALAGTRTALAVVLAAGGTLLPVASYRRWARLQHAMRLGRELPFTPLLLVVAATVSVVGVGLVIVAVLS
jgi:putative membrane protein